MRARGAVPYVVSAYVQSQYERRQDSTDQLLQSGEPANSDGFTVRRARLRLDGTFDTTSLAVEVDGNTSRGVTLRRGEASAFVRGPGSVPYAKLTLGLSEIPFGAELRESNRRRLFVERSLVSQAFFPSEADYGAVLVGGYGVFRYALAVQNGEPIDGTYGRRDPNAAKDVITRFGVDVGTPSLSVVFGTSFLRGKGFHPGTAAAKGSVVWRDTNENSMIDQGELTAVPETPATPSANFGRWAVGADLAAGLRTKVGWSRLAFEVSAASNLDRGVVPADPVVTGLDQRAVGFLVAASQELGRYVTLGVRYDQYDPNADFFVKRAGKLLPASQAVRTISPLVAVGLPGRARLTLQYDKVTDHGARDARGVPTDLRNDRLTLRAQVEL